MAAHEAVRRPNRIVVGFLVGNRGLLHGRDRLMWLYPTLAVGNDGARRSGSVRGGDKN